MRRWLLWLVFVLYSLTVQAAEEPEKTFADAKPVPELTGRYIYDFLKVAESQAGYYESAASETIYSDWAGQSGRAWCSEFLSWCAWRAGIPETIIPKKNAAKPMRTYYAQFGAYYLVEGGVPDQGCGCTAAARETISPEDIRPGDILLIETKGNGDPTTLDHTALCRGVEKKTGKVKILTIEGNVNQEYWIDGKKMTLGTVRIQSREVSQIHGICRPNYGNFCEAYAGSHTWDQMMEREADCQGIGLAVDTCRFCGKQKYEEIASLEHTWDAGTVQEAAAPLKNGWMRYLCIHCGEQKYERISAAGLPEVGTLILDQETGAYYCVTKAAAVGGTVAYAGPSKKTWTEIEIYPKVVLDGITYRVTSIADQAFANHKSVRSVYVPESVTRIGSRAFYKCSKLKQIVIMSKKLKKTSIGSKAFQGISKRAVFYVPRNKQKTYRKIFTARGAGKKNTFTTK